MSRDDEERRNLADRVYDEIKTQIVELRLPPESVVQERSLAEALGTSRTPVREALKRLGQDGWILVQEKRKIIVRGIGMDDVREVFMLREMVELFAIRSIFSSGEPRFLAGMLIPLISNMKNHTDDSVAFIKEDMKFHTAIITCMNNRRLDEIWRKISDEVTRIAIYSLHEQRRPEAVIREHEALAGGLWEMQCDVTVRRMVEHYHKIYVAYEDKFRRQHIGEKRLIRAVPASEEAIDEENGGVS